MHKKGVAKIATPIYLSTELDLASYNALTSCCNTAWVHDTDTDFLGHNPSKLELLWLVCWDNFDVLTDWHNTNELWVCCTVNGSWRNDLGNHDVCAPDVSVTTGLENLTLCNRIDLTAARSLTTAGSPVEDVGELSDVHEVLRCYKVPTINLSLDLNEVSLEKTT